MTKHSLLLLIALCLAIPAVAQSPDPLKFVQNIIMPGVPVGPYADHLAVDLAGHRLFATPQAHHSVQVFDLSTGKLLHELGGMGNPHSILYRSDLDRIYVTDEEPGLVRIFSGRDYHPLESVKGLAGADSIAYDPATKYLYVTNGGEDEGMAASLVSVIDTTTGSRQGDISVPAKGLEAMALERASARIYIDMTDENEIAVVDRQKRTVVATWPIIHGKKPIAIALDEEHHRLFVGCRNSDMEGAIVIMDTESGKEIETTLPVGGWVDYLVFDSQSKRLYASCGTGYVYVFAELQPDHYQLLGKAETAVMAKTGLLVPELTQFFVSVPHIDGTPAKILVFQVQ